MQMGQTKVFLRLRAFETLEQLRAQTLDKAAAKIQAFARMCAAQTQLEIAIYAATIIQKFYRDIEQYRLYYAQLTYNSASRIQNAYRCYRARRYYTAGIYIAWWCQSAYRGCVARQLAAYLFLDRKATSIQRAWKNHRSMRTFRRLRKAVIFAQTRFRGKLAFRKLCRLRREAKDLTNVAAERDRFKEEMNRLKKELDLEKERSAMTKKELRQEKAEEVQKLREEMQRLQVDLAIANQKRSPTKSEADNVKFLIQEVRNKEGLLESLRTELEGLKTANDSFSVQSLTFDNHANNDSFSLHSTNKRSSPLRSDISLLDSFSEQHVQNSADSPAALGRAPEQSFSYASDNSEHKQDEKFFPEGGPIDEGMIPDESSFSAEFTSQQHDQSKFYLSRNAMHVSYDSYDDADELRKLHNSIRQGNMALFSTVLDKTEDACVLINQGDRYGRTALHLAAIASNYDMASRLIHLGAISNAQDEDGETPLHLSELSTVTECLLRAGGANPNIPNVDGITALHLAVQRRDLDSVRSLIRSGADANNADNIRWFTALHLIALPARQEGNGVDADVTHRIAQLLVTGSNSSARPDLNDTDREGNTPLHFAVQLESPEASDLVSVLLEQGADPNICNERNQGALHLLCHNSKLRELNVFHETLQTMLTHGANPNLQSLTGCTALHLTLFHKDITSAIQLVQKGAELHILWKKPKRWESFWDDKGSSEVLALDMVEQPEVLQRIISSINQPQKWAPVRYWCMCCKNDMHRNTSASHCRHCSRYVCETCSSSCLPPEYFPKTFNITEPSWVCVTCEHILVARKEAGSNATSPSSAGSGRYSC